MSATITSLLTLSTMTLATCGSRSPHAAAVYFAATTFQKGELGSLRLYFFSDAQSQHGQDLAADPRAAAAIHPEVSGWRDIRGLQMHGLAQPVSRGDEWETAWGLYQAKFPFVASLQSIVQRNTLYGFIPNWLRLVDNRRRFGFKQEWLQEKCP